MRKKSPAGKSRGFFAWKLLKISFYMRNFTHRWSESGHFFPISKKGQERPPPSPSNYAPEQYLLENKWFSVGSRASLHYTAPKLAWQVLLRVLGITHLKYNSCALYPDKFRLEQLRDIDMLLLSEEVIRGGVTQAVKWYAKTNNKYM